MDDAKKGLNPGAPGGVRIVIDPDEWRRRAPKDFDDEGGGSGNGGPPAGGSDGDDGPATIFASDDHLARELVVALGEDWLAVEGRWLHWDGKRWTAEHTKLLWEIARGVCRRIAGTLDDKNLRRRVVSRRTIYDAAVLAEGDRDVAESAKVFDADPMLLNTPEGVVDLNNGELRQHDPMLRLTRLAGVGPDQACKTPLFNDYLRKVTNGDKEFERYLQRVAGYCLSGVVKEHAIFFFKGPSGTGKSTFQQIMQDLLGDYAVTVPIDMFITSPQQRHLAEIAQLDGARLVTTGEIQRGARWDEAKLSYLSGGDRINANRMRQDPYDFDPQHTLMFAGNYKPKIQSETGLRRRLHLIEFKYQFHTGGKKADRDFRKKLRPELPGIMAWALKGELERERLGGLCPPPGVIEATEEYFREQNPAARFVEECCELDPNGREVGQFLYQAFARWAEPKKEYVGKEPEFFDQLEQLPGELRYKRLRDDNGVRRYFMTGLRLKSGYQETLDLPSGRQREPGEEG